MYLIEKIQDKVSAYFNQQYQTNLPPNFFELQDTLKDFEGDWTLVIFPLLRYAKKKPTLLGEEIGTFLVDTFEEIAHFECIKGFVNLQLHATYWNQFVGNSIPLGKPLKKVAKPEKIMVEYSSPNTNKPLHLGHVRNNLIGYSVAAILQKSGHEVVKTNLVNDRGIHICKSMLAWLKEGKGETPSKVNMKGDKLVGKYYVQFEKLYQAEIKALKEAGKTEEEAKKEAPIMKEAQQMLKDWENNDEQVLKIWKKLNDWVYDGFEATYERLGVDFDRFYHESTTYLLGKNIIREGLQKKVFYQKPDGSVWANLEKHGLDQKLLLRKDGTSVYMTQDLGTARLKYEDYQINRSIYVVGNEQDYHFKVLKILLTLLEEPYASGIHHLSYGMVDLPSGKMKSREGTVVDADDLMDEMKATAQKYTQASGKISGMSKEEQANLFETLGLAALKFHILKTNPQKRMMFDPEASIDFQGHTGPFIQYAYTRILSILRKSNHQLEDTFELAVDLAKISQEDTPTELIKQWLKFEEALHKAAENLDPSEIAFYAYQLAKLFNQFYHEAPILTIEDENLKNYRLKMIGKVAFALREGMGLLGIKMPERM